MKLNYQPWFLRVDDFYTQPESDRIKFLLNFAVLAPSSHNSQPWRFEVKGRQISIFLELARRLREGDKNDRQAYISLGCAITNIVTAADHYGLGPTIKYFPNAGRKRLAANITLGKKSFAAPRTRDHPVFAILKRVTNRNEYRSKLPSGTILNKIKSFDTNDLSVFLITEKSKKSQLADIALASSVAAMEDRYFRRELSMYVKSNTTSSPVGMPCFGMGIPTPISFFAPTMIKFFNMNRLNLKKDESLLKEHTPVFAVIASRLDDAESWIKTGQAYQNIALLGARKGLASAMWASPIQIGEYYREFQRVLQTNFRPQAFFRLGYPVKKTPHSPRLMLVDVLV